MTIWIDADSCPRQVREMIFRAALRLRLPLALVANRPIPFPKNDLFSMILSDSSPDAADDYIVEHAETNDLIITRDIPLAKRLVDNKMRVINDRGTVYTETNINDRLGLRNLMLDLHNSGIYPAKTSQFGKKELQEFANALDRELQKMIKLRSLRDPETGRVLP